VLRSAHSALRQMLPGAGSRWRPLLAVHYLTYRCRFRCPYCSDGAAQPYWRASSPALAGPEVLRLLGRLRHHCEHLVLTGGEPLEHPDLPWILDRLPALGFETRVLTTNGDRLEEHLPALLGTLSHLVISLDGLDEARADARAGLGPGTLRRVLAQVERALRWPRRRCQLMISAVAGPETLADLPGLLDYCLERDLALAVAPQLVGVVPHPALPSDPRYRALFERLLALRRQGAPIYGSLRYLEVLRDLSAFDCRPLSLLATDPQGQVLYPCLEQGHRVGSLLEHDLDDLYARAQARHGPAGGCEGPRCHSACAVGFSQLLQSPLPTLLDATACALRERAWSLRRRARGAAGASAPSRPGRGSA